MANMAQRLDDAGANALVLFNRFYQPDIDLEEFEVKPNVILSTSHAMRLPMRWIAILKDKIAADLAATSGIHTGIDVVKMLLVGSNVDHGLFGSAQTWHFPYSEYGESPG
jgi:dihydroorotate dehydrogenase (fumarate)